jgi:hypothetical protein
VVFISNEETSLRQDSEVMGWEKGNGPTGKQTQRVMKKLDRQASGRAGELGEAGAAVSATSVWPDASHPEPPPMWSHPSPGRVQHTPLHPSQTPSLSSGHLSRSVHKSNAVTPLSLSQVHFYLSFHVWEWTYSTCPSGSGSFHIT